MSDIKVMLAESITEAVPPEDWSGLIMQTLIHIHTLERRLDDKLCERIAILTAHRACCSSEHNPSAGRLHGCCVVCGVPWPCEYAGKP